MSSETMEDSTRLMDIVKLGERLVEKLESDQHGDLLSKWMAHHIARLMKEAETASDSEKKTAERDCADAIMKLWSHRAFIWREDRPFQSFDPIFRTIERIADDNSYFYFQKQETNERNSWLDLAEAVDRVARSIISFSLAVAAEQSSTKETDWIKLAEKVEPARTKELVVIKFITQDYTDDTAAETSSSKGVEKLKSFKEKLDVFKKINTMMSRKINRMINQ